MIFAFSLLLISPALAKTKSQRKPAHKTETSFCFSKTFSDREKRDFGNIDSFKTVSSPGTEDQPFLQTGVIIFKNKIEYAAGYECFTKQTKSSVEIYECKGIEDNGHFDFTVRTDKSKAQVKIKGTGLALGFVGDPILDYEPRLKTILLEKCEGS